MCGAVDGDNLGTAGSGRAGLHNPSSSAHRLCSFDLLFYWLLDSELQIPVAARTSFFILRRLDACRLLDAGQ
jgi:hypothetical protein